MSDTSMPRFKFLDWLPVLRSRWWTVLLGLSLMFNLAIIGFVSSDRWSGGRAERIMGASYIQLIPRSFLRELSRERRQEIMELVRERSKSLRELRDVSQSTPLKLADALAAEPYDVAVVKAAVDSFTTGSESLAAGGGAVVMEIVGKLTPEERKALVAAIRDRASRAKRRR